MLIGERIDTTGAVQLISAETAFDDIVGAVAGQAAVGVVAQVLAGVAQAQARDGVPQGAALAVADAASLAVKLPIFNKTPS